MLQTGEVIPTGADHGRTVDVAVCAATHVDLEAAIAAGRFRADLYERLVRITVHLPPLRARREEIPFLVDLAVEDAYDELDLEGEVPRLAPSVFFYEECIRRDWPRNVRQLFNAVSSAVVSASLQPNAKLLEPGFLPSVETTISVIPARPSPPIDARPSSPRPSAGLTPRQQAQVDELVAILRGNGSNLAAAAQRLGISARQAYRRLERAGLRLPVT